MTKALSIFVILLACGCGGSTVNEPAGGTSGSGPSSGNGGVSGSGGTGSASGASGSSGGSAAGGTSGSSGGSAGRGGSTGANGTSGSGSAGTSAAGGTSGSGGSGGASGSGGSGGTSGSGGSSGSGCQAPEQCRLFSDCCSCVALGPGEPGPMPCPADCVQDRCSALGVSAAVCSAGQCSAGFNCVGTVTCPALPPACQPGQVPSISGSCWGPCVPATQCVSVTNCDQCYTVSGQICVDSDTLAGTHYSFCLRVPERCANMRECACFGESFCPAPMACWEFSGRRGVRCEYPTP